MMFFNASLANIVSRGFFPMKNVAIIGPSRGTKKSLSGVQAIILLSMSFLITAW